MANLLAKLLSMLTPKRRWAQFSLRRLFVMVAIAAAPCIWLEWKAEQTRKERVLIAEIQEGDGYVIFDWQIDGRPRPMWKKWASKVLGDQLFANVIYVHLGRRTTDKNLAMLAGLMGLEYLDTSTVLYTLHMTTLGQNRNLTDASVAQLRRLKGLKGLDVTGTVITASGIAELNRALPNCNIVCADDDGDRIVFPFAISRDSPD